MTNSEKRKRLISAISVILIGIIIIIFGAWQIRNSIFEPLALPESASEEVSPEDLEVLRASLSNLNTEPTLEEKIRLQEVDTDRDGLDDYEEKFVHNTSVYLDDTDSDGINDYDEIRAGSDPNCPQGALCELTNQAKTTTEGQTEVNSNANISATASLTSSLGEFSTDELRELLKNSGLPKELIDQLDDQTLNEIYQETLQSSDLEQGLEQLIVNSSQTSTAVNAGEQTAAEKVDELVDKNPADYSLEEIRQLLIVSGVDSLYVNSLSEADLREILEAALGMVP